MDNKEFKVRCFERAIDQSVQVLPRDRSDLFWRAKSVSRPGIVYDLEVVRGEVMVCSCQGFALWGFCKHAAAVILALRLKAHVAAGEAKARQERDESILLPDRLHGRQKLLSCLDD